PASPACSPAACSARAPWRWRCCSPPRYSSTRSRRRVRCRRRPSRRTVANVSLMVVLSRADVEELLDLDELVGALARAHEELSAGSVSMPPRIAAFAGEAGLLGVMPAYLPSAGLGCKLVTLFPHNRDPPT